MKDVIYWLKQIHATISNLNGSVATANQSDWNEDDDTSAAYIQNKPTIPDAQIQSDWNQSTDTAKDYIKNKPTVPSVTVVSGTVSDSAFTADAGQPTLAEAAAAIEAGNFVYLKYTSTDKDIYEMVIACDADTPSITTKNLTWTA